MKLFLLWHNNSDHRELLHFQFYSSLFTKLVATYTTTITGNLTKHLIKYYKLLQNWQKLFTAEIYRNINLSCLLLRTQLDRSVSLPNFR